MFGAAALASCVQMPVLGRADLPVSPGAGPVSYRVLSDIPQAPEISPAAVRQEAVEALTAERAANAQAVSRLREEPFTPPAPLPPPDPEFR